MNRRNMHKKIPLTIAAFAFSGIASLAQDKAQRLPNIVYILTDDMGYGDVSSLNPESKIKTPNIDSLANEGMIFTDAHSGSAVCTPTRYGILTGRYCWRTRLKKGVLNGYSKHLIKKDRMTVGSLLKQCGYHTACIGKWHLGWDWSKPDGKKVDFTAPVKNGPDINGFDYYYSHCGSLDMPPYVYVENGKVTAQPDRDTQHHGYGFWRKGPTGADFVHEDVLPNFTKRGVDYINKRAATGEPFFLYLPFPAPHTPILPTKEFRGKSGTNPYGDFVLQVDWSIGQIAKALKDSGVANNTLVIVTSDNGCSPTANFSALAKLGHNPNYIYRGHKADIFEGGHRIPFIVRWPGKVNASSVSAETICLTDLLATCAAIIDKPLPNNAGEDSYNILPLMLGKKQSTPIREATVHHSINGSFSIRRGKWKLELCAGSGGWSSPTPGKTKGLPPVQLYDLKNDIAETSNVQDKHPEVVKELTVLLEKYKCEGRSVTRK